MKYYILSFIFVMCFTTVLGGAPNARKYKGVGVTDAKIDDRPFKWIPAQKADGMVGEMIMVDMDRDFNGYAHVKDVKT